MGHRHSAEGPSSAALGGGSNARVGQRNSAEGQSRWRALAAPKAAKASASASSAAAAVAAPAPEAKREQPRIPAGPWEGWDVPSRYEVHRIIGKGSYGTVCQAQDRESGNLVAIKQLKRLFADLIDCKRILRELAILTRLNHDHVVRVYDIIAPDDMLSFSELYIVLELADSDLKKLIRTDVVLTLLHVKKLLFNILVGVRYIHSAGVLHRDMKPANCLVNENCDIKICDFGLARAIGGETDHADHEVSAFAATPWDEQTEVVVVPSTLRKKRLMTQHVVTRWYRAPELILLDDGYTEAIDIWSVGCIFGELMQMVDNDILVGDRGPLFPGGSCFPLSPDKKNSQKKHRSRGGQTDQLEVIFNILGTPPEDHVAMLSGEDARKYLQQFQPREGKGLQGLLPRIDPEALDLLQKMLSFCAPARITIPEALEHPLFLEVRDASKETTATGLIKLDFEDEADLNVKTMRRCFSEEIQRFHREI